MRRIVLSGQKDFSDEGTFAYFKTIQEEARKQWIIPPAVCKLTVFVMFYLDEDAEHKSMSNLLRPIIRTLRRIVYMNENQIFQLSVGKITRLKETEPRKVEVLIEDYEDVYDQMKP